MTYDAGRNLLWVGHYYATEVGKINAANGSVVATKSLGTVRPYGLDMEDGDLWVADYSGKNFKCFNPADMNVAQTINAPGAWSYGPGHIARADGRSYSAQYSDYDIYKLDPGSGAIQKSFAAQDRLYYYYNHLEYANGSLWQSRYTQPRNVIHEMNYGNGALLNSYRIGDWPESCYIYDLSFANSNEVWLLMPLAEESGGVSGLLEEF